MNTDVLNEETSEYVTGKVRIFVNEIDILMEEFERVEYLLKEKGEEICGMTNVKLEIIEEDIEREVDYCELSFDIEANEDFICPLHIYDNEAYNDEIAKDRTIFCIGRTLKGCSVIYNEQDIEYELN